MRKKITLSIVVLSVLMMSITFGVYAAVKHSLIINGKTINADIKVINGTTYVPLRVITENVESIDLKYDPSNKTITVNDRKEETVTSNEVDTAPINNIGKELTKYELEDLLTRDYSKL
ncbi:hypothetical protein GOL43_33690, partial [Sinorhizobium medicae]|nr:hypothetical protein [Sinorhizobium medicae]